MISKATVGDVLESAIWLDGRETAEHRKAFEAEVNAALALSARRHGHVLGPVTWTEKKPGDDRVPPVPNHIQGPNVRLLVAEAMIVNTVSIMRELPGFAHDLESDDLALLRRITRRKYREQYPGQPELTDRQCDTLINDLGPEAALDTLKALKPSDLI